MQTLDLRDLSSILDLPPSAHVDRRVPKNLILEYGAPTPADKKNINEGIEELYWLAALKPTTIGVPEYRDTIREYQEIAVLRLTLRAEARTERLVELVHRAVPYPLLMLCERNSRQDLSAAHKRRAQNEAGKTMLDGEVVTTGWNAACDADHWQSFHAAMALGRQPRISLYALYQGWIDTILALQAARITGVFRSAADPEKASARQESLRECARLDTEIARLRAAAMKEKQVARQVELNLELKRMEAAHAAARAKL